MEEKKVVRRDKKDITDNRNKQKKMLLAAGVVLFAVLYVFLLTVDMDKNSENISEEILEEITTEKEEDILLVSELNPVEGGTISISVSRFNSLNPLKNKEKSLDAALKLVYDSLFEFDSQYNIKNELASSYTFNQDATELTVVVSPGAKWHDGTPVNGSDIVFTINYIMNNADSPYNYLVANIKSATANGNKAIISLKQPNALEIYNMIFPIISQKSFNNTSAELNDGTFGVLGNGMYKPVSYKQGKQFVLKKNDNYYGAKPYLDGIVVKIFDNKDIRKNMFIASNVDIIDSDYYELSKYNYDVFSILPYESRKFDMVAFNTSKPPFDNQKNRASLASILDLKKISEDAYRDKIDLNLLPINKNSDMNLAQTNIYEYSEVRAKRFSNFESEQKIVIVTDKDDPMKYRLAYMIKNQLELLKVDAEVRAVANSEINDIMSTKNYNIMIMEYKVPVDKDITRLLNKYNIVFGYDMSEFNSSMSEVKKTISEEKMKEKYKKLQEEIIYEMPFIGIGFRSEYMIVNDKIKGSLEPNEFEIYNGIENLFIDN